ncbi:hypothetical protein C8Q78DRAFT_1083834 [Trametes maxima]|nr:hypothetical protein C8Q78DRAFT_1083834 [Trametes maxima]
MSSTTSSSTSSSSAQSTASGPPGGQNGQYPTMGPALTSSASLYLYTFLATLVLLLLVSATIIARSYVIRRRHREFIAQAIANGTYVPPARIRIGKKPKMFEVALVREVEGAEPRRIPEKTGGWSSIEKEKRRESSWDGLVVEWDKMMPVSCRIRRPPRPRPQPDDSISSNPELPPPSRFSRWRWLSRGLRRTPPSISSSTTSPSPSSRSPRASQPTLASSPSPADPRPSSATMCVASPTASEKSPLAPSLSDEHARVAVLISMPFAAAFAAKKASEYGRSAPDLPYMEFGVCEVPLDAPLAMTGILSPSSSPNPSVGGVAPNGSPTATYARVS